MDSPFSEELPRGELARESMETRGSREAEARLLELLGGRAEDWPDAEFGWRPWLRARPVETVVLGRAGGGSCFVFSPIDHTGFWAVQRGPMRGKGALTESEIAALEAIAVGRGIRGAGS